MQKWSPQVWLHRETTVRRLHPMPLSDTLDFAGELSLRRRIADVFDHGVAEDQIEGLVREWNAQPVTHHDLDSSRRCLGGPRCVQQNQLGTNRRKRPYFDGAPDIQHPPIRV